MFIRFKLGIRINSAAWRRANTLPNIKAAVGGARQETWRFVFTVKNRAAAAAAAPCKQQNKATSCLHPEPSSLSEPRDLLPADRLQSESKRVDFCHLLLIYNQHLLAEVGQAPLAAEGVCFVPLGEPDGRRLAQEDR